MINIDAIMEERGYDGHYRPIHELTFYIVFKQISHFERISFLIDKKTGKEYFKEKGYFAINTNPEKKLVRMNKRGLRYRTKADFKTMKLEGAKEFY